MKKILIFLCLFNVYFYSVCDASENALQIYLCARLSESAKEWNNKVTNALNSEFTFFRPQDVDLTKTPSNEIDWKAYEADIEGMKQSDILLVLPPYGRDCAWEIGWFCGKERPALAYVENHHEWLRDAMVKGGLTAIITNDIEVYNALLKDPATSSKSYFISSKDDLAKKIKQIINK